MPNISKAFRVILFLFCLIFMRRGVAGTPQVIVTASTDEVSYLPQSFQTSDGLLLTGHLTLPKHNLAPLPVVLLISGSGTHNRYEDISSGC